MRAAVVLVLAGCNQIYGLEATTALLPDADTRADRDNDGIADVDDPCIAGAYELSLDYDADGLTLDDPCPFLAGTADGDNDGVPDACDPFPLVAGDRRRCITTFSNTDVTASLWLPRTGEQAWTVHPGSIRTGLDDVRSDVAAEVVEAPTSTTFEIGGYHLHNSGQSNRMLAFWLRAGSEPSPADLWCVLRSDNVESRVVIESAAQPNAVVSAAGPAALSTVTFTVKLTVEPASSGTNVSCRFELDGTLTTGVVAAAGHVVVPPGHFGFFASHVYGVITRMTIFERDVPAL